MHTQCSQAGLHSIGVERKKEREREREREQMYVYIYICIYVHMCVGGSCGFLKGP